VCVCVCVCVQKAQIQWKPYKYLRPCAWLFVTTRLRDSCISMRCLSFDHKSELVNCWWTSSLKVCLSFVLFRPVCLSPFLSQGVRMVGAKMRTTVIFFLHILMWFLKMFPKNFMIFNFGPENSQPEYNLSSSHQAMDEAECLSVCLSVCLPVCLSVWLSATSEYYCYQFLTL